jgi:aspartate carbamoyltransferase catalytic subunit
MNRRHLIDLDDFSLDEIDQVMSTTDSMREVLSRPISRVPTLRGVTVVNMFYEASTRTRVSFELAAKNLSADTISVTASTSSVTKQESLVDTMRTLQALGADVIVVRHSESGSPYLIAQHVAGSVINAGDGWHAHPTQALLDFYTMRDRFGSINGLKVVIVGDILHSRVARSNLWGLTKAGAGVVVVGPPTLLPADACGGCDGVPPVEVEYDLDRALINADVVMALRIQRERQDGAYLPSLREYILQYQVNDERLKKANPNALVMHPGPMNEGVEIAPDVAYGSQSVIEEQVTNGVAVRMALLYELVGRTQEM